MPFKHTIKVGNASPYERSDYVEVDLESAGVPTGLAVVYCESRFF
jgi:hypothetical protein